MRTIAWKECPQNDAEWNKPVPQNDNSGSIYTTFLK